MLEAALALGFGHPSGFYPRGDVALALAAELAERQRLDLEESTRLIQNLLATATRPPPAGRAPPAAVAPMVAAGASKPPKLPAWQASWADLFQADGSPADGLDLRTMAFTPPQKPPLLLGGPTGAAQSAPRSFRRAAELRPLRL